MRFFKKLMQTLRGIVQAHYLTTQYLHAHILVTQKIPISAHYSVHASWDRSGIALLLLQVAHA